MNATERQIVFDTAIQQAKQQTATVRISRQEMADTLIREALAAFLDPDAVIDLRDWVKSARAHLGQP